MLEKNKKIALACLFGINLLFGADFNSFANQQEKYTNALTEQNKRANINKALLQSVFLDTASQNFQTNKTVRLIGIDIEVESMIESDKLNKKDKQ